MNNIEAIARFVRSHPGFYVSHNDRGVVAVGECVDVNTGEQWSEYLTLLTMQGARDWLGY